MAFGAIILVIVLVFLCLRRRRNTKANHDPSTRALSQNSGHVGCNTSSKVLAVDSNHSNGNTRGNSTEQEKDIESGHGDMLPKIPSNPEPVHLNEDDIGVAVSIAPLQEENRANGASPAEGQDTYVMANEGLPPYNEEEKNVGRSENAEQLRGETQ